MLDDALAFFDMLHFTAAKKHVYQHFIVVQEELARLIDFRFNVVFARFRTDANFLQFLLVRFDFVAFPGLRITEFAVIHDLADGRTLGRCHFHEIEIFLASHFHGLRSWNNA